MCIALASHTLRCLLFLCCLPCYGPWSLLLAAMEGPHRIPLATMNWSFYLLAHCILAATANSILAGRDLPCQVGTRICGHQILESGESSDPSVSKTYKSC